MAEFSNFLDLDLGLGHTAYHSSTSTYIPNFIEIKETFCGRTDKQMYGRMDIFLPMLLGRLGGVDLKMRQKYEIKLAPYGTDGQLLTF